MNVLHPVRRSPGRGGKRLRDHLPHRPTPHWTPDPLERRVDVSPTVSDDINGASGEAAAADDEASVTDDAHVQALRTLTGGTG